MIATTQKQDAAIQQLRNPTPYACTKAWEAAAMISGVMPGTWARISSLWVVIPPISMPSQVGGSRRGSAAGAILPGISVDNALLNIAVLTARPTVPPNERTAIIRVEAVEIKAGGVHN